MGYNPWNLPNRANVPLQEQTRAFASLLNAGKIRSSLLDLDFANFGDTAQEPFFISGSVVPQNIDSELVIMQYQVQPGMCAIITDAYQFYDSGGQANNWVQGDGQLQFFLSVDYRYVPNFMNLATAFGSLQNPQTIPRGIPVMSGQLISYTYICNASTLIVSDPARLVAGLQGVILPIR